MHRGNGPMTLGEEAGHEWKISGTLQQRVHARRTDRTRLQRELNALTGDRLDAQRAIADLDPVRTRRLRIPERTRLGDADRVGSRQRPLIQRRARQRGEKFALPRAITQSLVGRRAERQRGDADARPARRPTPMIRGGADDGSRRPATEGISP